MTVGVKVPGSMGLSVPIHILFFSAALTIIGLNIVFNLNIWIMRRGDKDSRSDFNEANSLNKFSTVTEVPGSEY